MTTYLRLAPGRPAPLAAAARCVRIVVLAAAVALLGSDAALRRRLAAAR